MTDVKKRPGPTSVRFGEDRERKLADAAEKERRSKNQIVTFALDEWFIANGYK